ncbi:hypothetical protein [Streptomyces sp. NPDC047976]|uniref:hypothetical protein n=1 Tax=Streptomyces sp. NPDC047976 TaxID=3155746 RepID=UPI00343B71EE
MFRSTLRGAAAAALTVTLAALTVSCGNDAEPKAKASPPAAAASPATSAPVPGAASPAASPAGTGTPAPAATPTAWASASGPLVLPSTPPELVRDAFAGLQATLNDSCTPGNCAYFLGRVYDELHRLDRAMKADSKGPGHFPEPIALIVKLDKELGGDRTFENLKKHQSALIGTRDQINTWMQDHPDDYR